MQVSCQRAKCKCTCNFTASVAATRAVNEVVPLHLQCKVTKSVSPFILNLICYRGKKISGLSFSTITITLTKTLSIKYRNKPILCNQIIGTDLKTVYISIHLGTHMYQKNYMHAPRAVHACTFLTLTLTLTLTTSGGLASRSKLTLSLASTLIFRGAWLSLTLSFSSMRSHGLTVPQSPQISASPDSG